MVDSDGIVEDFPHDMLHKIDSFSGRRREERSSCLVHIVHAFRRWVLPRSVGHNVGVWAPDVGI